MARPVYARFGAVTTRADCGTGLRAARRTPGDGGNTGTRKWTCLIRTPRRSGQKRLDEGGGGAPLGAGRVLRRRLHVPHRPALPDAASSPLPVRDRPSAGRLSFVTLY